MNLISRVCWAEKVFVEINVYGVTDAVLQLSLIYDLYPYQPGHFTNALTVYFWEMYRAIHEFINQIARNVDLYQHLRWAGYSDVQCNGYVPEEHFISDFKVGMYRKMLYIPRYRKNETGLCPNDCSEMDTYV